MKKIIAITLSLVLVFCFAGCGNDAEANADAGKQDTVTPSVTEAPETTTEAPADVKNAETVAVGNTITLPFAELTVDEAGIKDDIKQTIKSDGIRYTTGPDRSDDKEFVYIRGTIKNTSKSAINSVELKGAVEIDGYSYDIADIDLIESNGRWTYSIDPLITYIYTIYAEVPNQLVENLASCTMIFGFDENFEYIQHDATSVAYNYAIAISK